MSDLHDLSRTIDKQFQASFGRTPLAERVVDVLSQATSLGRFTDLENLRDEAGDVLCSVLQLCTECGWDPQRLAASSLEKIASRDAVYKSLGRKLKVGLLGGAFDPIHRGHLEVARAVLQHGGVDEVRLMPCFEHLAGKSMVASEHRLEMCRIAARSLRAVGVFDYELRHKFRGETYHLIKSLLTEEIARLHCDFSLIIGQDNADAISTWTNGEALERMISFIVVPRPGCEPPKPNAWYLRPPHRYLSEATSAEALSSTEVRRLLQRHDPTAEALLPPGVFEYVRTHDLYRPPASVVVPASTRKTAVFVSTFDPPSAFHRAAAQQLLQTGFDDVVVCPAQSLAATKQPEHAASMHRAALTDLNFRGLERTQVDLSELERATQQFGQVERLYERDAETWLVVDIDQIVAGGEGRSLIHLCWENGAERWHRSRFVVLHPPGEPPRPEDLPPRHRLLPLEKHASTAILRRRVYAGESIREWVVPEVADYIERHRLFLSFVPRRETRLRIDSPRLMLEFDERNPKAVAVAARYRPFVHDQPNMILVVGGDGTMLHAIRRLWRLRLPFVGLNAGHLGFLANERLPSELGGLELGTHLLPMLRVDSQSVDGRMTRSLAFGDAWMERDGGQAAWLRLDVDGRIRVEKIVGDGMLVATAAGSSAYARALGASPLPLNAPVLTLAGSNVFQPRFWKPMALNDDAVVTLAALDRTGKRPVRGYVDGQPLGLIESLDIARSSIANVELAFAGEFDPSAKLLRSLFPPTENA